MTRRLTGETHSTIVLHLSEFLTVMVVHGACDLENLVVEAFVCQCHKQPHMTTRKGRYTPESHGFPGCLEQISSLWRSTKLFVQTPIRELHHQIVDLVGLQIKIQSIEDSTLPSQDARNQRVDEFLHVQKMGYDLPTKFILQWDCANAHSDRTGSFSRAASFCFSISVLRAAWHSTSQAARTNVSADRALSWTLQARNSAEMLMICKFVLSIACTSQSRCSFENNWHDRFRHAYHSI